MAHPPTTPLATTIHPNKLFHQPPSGKPRCFSPLILIACLLRELWRGRKHYSEWAHRYSLLGHVCVQLTPAACPWVCCAHIWLPTEPRGASRYHTPPPAQRRRSRNRACPSQREETGPCLKLRRSKTKGWLIYKHLQKHGLWFSRPHDYIRMMITKCS